MICPSEGWDHICTVLRHQYVPGQQSKLGKSECPLVVTDLCFYWATDPDMVVNGHRPGSHHGSRWHQWPLTSGYSSSISLSLLFTSFHCAHIFLLLFHFSTTYFLLLVVPRISEYLGSGVVSEAVSGVLCSVGVLWRRAGVILSMICPSVSVRCQTHSHLLLAPHWATQGASCKGCLSLAHFG